MTLRTELLTDPIGMGYSAYIPHAPGKLVEMLNDLSQSAPASRYINVRTILSDIDDGVAILEALEAAEGAVPILKWIMPFLKMESGVNIGNLRTLFMLNQLSGTVLTEAQANSLKALAMQPVSRAAVIGLGTVTEEQVREVIA